MSELISVKTAEFLNTKANYMLQVLPEHAGDDPESGLIRVPDGAEILSTCGEDKYLIFWKDGFNKVLGVDKVWDGNDIQPYKKFSISYPMSRILWQRNTLQQKVDEVRQHLGVKNNEQLSIMMGHDSSYLRKLLGRNATEKTKAKVFAKLDELVVNAMTRETVSNTTDECKQCALKNTVIQQANDIAEMWEENYKQSSKLNAWLFFIIILFIGLFVAWWAL